MCTQNKYSLDRTRHVYIYTHNRVNLADDILASFANMLNHVVFNVFFSANVSPLLSSLRPKMSSNNPIKMTKNLSSAFSMQ